MRIGAVMHAHQHSNCRKFAAHNWPCELIAPVGGCDAVVQLPPLRILPAMLTALPLPICLASCWSPVDSLLSWPQYKLNPIPHGTTALTNPALQCRRAEPSYKTTADSLPLQDAKPALLRCLAPLLQLQCI
jgi:hypothetical protein